MEQKTEVQGIYKTSEGVLINKDNEALLQYRKAKEKHREMSNLKEEVAEIKSDISEIKELLKGLVK